MVENTINVIAGEAISSGCAVTMGKRTWKERLFSWPWMPWVKYKVTKLQEIERSILSIPGVEFVRIYENK